MNDKELELSKEQAIKKLKSMTGKQIDEAVEKADRETFNDRMKMLDGISKA